MLNAHGIGVKLTNQYSGGRIAFEEHIVPLLGNPMEVNYMCDKEQAQYIAALRTKTNVHATLREFVNQSADFRLDSEISKYCNRTPDVGPFGYYLVRGTETVEIMTI